MGISMSVHLVYGFPTDERKFFDWEENRDFCDRLESEKIQMNIFGNIMGNHFQTFFYLTAVELHDKYGGGRLDDAPNCCLPLKELQKEIDQNAKRHLEELAKEMGINLETIDWYAVVNYS